MNCRTNKAHHIGACDRGHSAHEDIGWKNRGKINIVACFRKKCILLDAFEFRIVMTLPWTESVMSEPKTRTRPASTRWPCELCNSTSLVLTPIPTSYSLEEPGSVRVRVFICLDGTSGFSFVVFCWKIRQHNDTTGFQRHAVWVSGFTLACKQAEIFGCCAC